MAEILLRDGKTVALVSGEDVARVNEHKWYRKPVHNTAHAVADIFMNHTHKRMRISMHHFILEVPKTQRVYHVNGNGLDNRRENLTTVAQPLARVQLRLGPSHPNSSVGPLNIQGRAKTSRFRGVSAAGSRWRAQIMVAGIPVHLGMFDTDEQAALRYDQAAGNYFGRFAMLNFPDRQEAA